MTTPDPTAGSGSLQPSVPPFPMPDMGGGGWIGGGEVGDLAHLAEQAGSAMGTLMEYGLKIGAIVAEGDEHKIARLGALLDELMPKAPGG